jgi:signal peptidase II
MSKVYSSASALFLGFLGLGLLCVDILTKYLTYAHLPVSNRFSLWYPYGGIAVFKSFLGVEFSINHTINHGAAWGIFAESQEFLLVLRIMMITGLIAYLLFYNQNKAWELPLLLITTGALGNVVDTFVYGHVVDMFHFVLWGYDFPVFNVADICITLGVSWLFLSSLFQSEKVHNHI